MGEGVCAALQKGSGIFRQGHRCMHGAHTAASVHPPCASAPRRGTLLRSAAAQMLASAWFSTGSTQSACSASLACSTGTQLLLVTERHTRQAMHAAADAPAAALGRVAAAALACSALAPPSGRPRTSERQALKGEVTTSSWSVDGSTHVLNRSTWGYSSCGIIG